MNKDTDTLPLQPIRAGKECAKFASHATLKKCEELDAEINEHIKAAADFKKQIADARAGLVDLRKPFDHKQRLVRQKYDLLSERIVLIEKRIASRGVLRAEFSPYKDARHNELIEAQKKALVEAERIYPPTDSPNRYDKRIELVEQLTRHEARAAQWVPTVLERNLTMIDANDLKEARAELAKEFCG